MLHVHLMVPMNLLQWLVGHSSHGESKFFQHKYKIINFNKDMVDKVFGFPSGVKPFVMESIGPEIISEIDEIRVEYLLGKKNLFCLVLMTRWFLLEASCCYSSPQFCVLLPTTLSIQNACTL
jgi:hypothetical protein